MQIAGNQCSVCSRTIGIMRDGAGCVKCQRVFHRACLKDTVCPNCGASLLPTEMVHETRVGPPTQVGIGGWLILPAIGLVLGPIASIVVLFKAADLYSAVSAAGYGAIYALDLLLEGSLLLFIIYAATRFFGRKTNAPVIVISVLILSLGTYAVVLAAALATGAKVFAAAAAKELARGAIAAAIWIPYFRVSKRVKATFVN